MSILTISVLGSPEVRWEDVPIRLQRPRIRALLYRLAVQEEPILRRHVGFLFWPRKPESTALRYVAKLCTQLRRTLPDRTALMVEGGAIGLNPSLVVSDAVRFQQLAAAYRCQPDSGLLFTLADLYHGPLLYGFSLPDCPEYEAWMGVARTLWRRDYLAVLQLLLEHTIDEEEYDRAAAIAQRFLDVDPANEEMHRCLIDLYGCTGDRAAAEQQFAACVEVLRREHGRSPRTETVLAYRAATDEQVACRQINVPHDRLPLFAEPNVRRRQWWYEPGSRQRKINLF